MFNGRVDGDLAVARAFGDFTYKQREDLPPEAQEVSCEPEIRIRERKETDRMLVLACDGVWDVVSDDQACTVVRESLQQHGGNSTVAAAALRDWAYINGSNDNISVIVVSLPGHL